MFRKPQKTKFPDSTEKALEYALRVLSVKWYGFSEMQEKLATKGFSGEVVDQVMQRLVELGYISDQRLLEGKLAEYRDFGSYGKNYIVQKLLQKHFSKEQVDEALEEHWSEEVELVCAERFLEKQKLPKGELEYKEKQKLIAKFLRRGFSYDVVREIVNRKQ